MKKLVLLTILVIFLCPVFLHGFTYLTQEEYRALCGDERREYNAALLEEMDAMQNRKDDALAAGDELEPEVEALRRQLNALNQEIAALERQRTEEPVTQVVTEPVAEPVRRAGDGDYVVQEGDSLWRIAGFGNIYNDNIRWPEIYQANQNQINNPNLIFPGQILIIPR